MQRRIVSSFASLMRGQRGSAKTRDLFWRKSRAPNLTMRCLSTIDKEIFADADDSYKLSEAGDKSNAITITSALPFDQLKKTTKKLIDAPKGTLNLAEILELTTSISAWHSHATSHQNDEETFNSAEALLHRILDEYDMNPSIEISVDIINKVLDTWRIISNNNAPTKFNRTSLSPGWSTFVQRGLGLLRHICEIHRANNETNENGLQHPNDISFNIVFDAFAKFGMAKDADALMTEIIDISQKGQPQCRPGTITYNTLLSAHANSVYLSGKIEHAEKAIDILEDMLELYNATNSPDIKPDVISFSTVIAACAHASSISSTFAQSAEDILDQMKEMYEGSLIENGGDGEWLAIKPNHICYASVINAWSNSRLPNAAEQASKIFAGMQQADGSQHPEALTALLGAYGNSEDESGILQAEEILNQMIEVAKDSGNMDAMPNVITFTTLIDCLAQSVERSFQGDGGHAAMKAESIVRNMEECSVKPSTITYNALINVWSKTQRSDSGEKAAYWLKHMEEQDDIIPDAATYTSVIDAYARCGMAEEAEQVLKKLIAIGKNGDSACRPNIVSFSTAINAYANKGQPAEAERVLNLMNKLRVQEKWADLKADPFCFNGIINAHIKSKQKNSLNRCLDLLTEMESASVATTVSHTAVIEGLAKAHRHQGDAQHVGKTAAKLLQRMWQLYDEGSDGLMPTVVTYASIINLFAKCQNHEKAEYYLDELERKYNQLQVESLRPNVICYNACLSSFSKATTKDEALRAEALLHRMTHQSGLSPDSFSMTNVISAWSNSNHPERAEHVLNTMQSIYEDGNEAMKPTTVSFGAVLQGFARAGDTKRAEAIVEHMEKLMNTDGYGEMRPNTVIYNILINAYARSRAPGAIDKVLLILDKMKKYREEGHSDTNPTIITYNSILSAFASSRSDEYERAKNLLQELEEAKRSEESISPNSITYTTFLKILTTSRVPKKTLIAESIISVMEKDLDNPKLRPNNFTYDAVIKLCGRPSSNDAKLRRHALILAVKTLTKIQDLPHIQETPYSYGAFFSTLAKLTSGQEYAILLEKSFRDCCIAGVLDERVLDNLIRTAPRNIVQPLLSTTVSLREITLKDLPQSWSRTSRGSITTRSQRSTERSTHNTGRTKIKR
jgi:pentatricopeptide repeat protein